jgi:oxygen-dependent protoporphyrinogen oxidase
MFHLMPKHIVVVGGGISGLAAVERLMRESSTAEPFRVTLLESSDRVGGVIRTDRDDGFLLEAGPDVILAAKPAGMEMCERLGIGDRIIEPGVKGSLILDGHTLRPIPAGMNGLMPSRIGPFLSTPLLSPIAKLRVALEYFVPVRSVDDDESVEHFVVRRLGREMYLRLVEPLLTGIFAGDGARLSIAATFPQLRAMERDRGRIVRGMLANKNGAARADHRRPTGLVSLRDGLGGLVESLASAIASESRVSREVVIRRRAAVRQITKSPSDDDGFVVTLRDGGSLTADAVIVATPAHAAARVLASLDSSLSSELDSIDYASTVTINVGYRAADVPQLPAGTGYTVPRVLGRSVLACTFTSNKFAGRAPADRALFRLFLGGAGRTEVTERTDEELVTLVRAELAEVLGIRAEPVLVRVNRFDRVMAQYNVGHLARLDRIDRHVARHGGLALAGNGYRGVGIPDCITSGRRAAGSVLTVPRARSTSSISSVAI